MKIEFIQGKYEGKIELPKEVIETLKKYKEVGVYTTTNYIDFLPQIMEILQKEGVKTATSNLPHTSQIGQILGCSFLDKKIQLNKEIEAYFYFGDGLFHPKSIKLKLEKSEIEKPVFYFNPQTKEFKEITKSDVSEIMKKRKAGMLKFLTSKKIGILVSTKYGQQKLKKALELKNSKKYSDKEFFILIDDTFDFSSLENFNFIECFVNTACPRISYDDSVRLHKPIIDIEELDL